MICNICRVSFIEIAQGKFALLARLWHRKGRIYGSESNMKHGVNIWNKNFFPNDIKCKGKPSHKYGTILLQDWNQSHEN